MTQQPRTPGAGTTFGVDFLGCKISLTDARTISEALAEAGHSATDARRDDAAARGIGVVNACCITAEAERTSRRKVRIAVGALEDSHGQVFVTGCGAANLPERYEAIDPRVRVVPGAAGLAARVIVEAADELAGLGCRGPIAGVAPGHVAAAPAVGPEATRRSRAFIKVQDGCDFSCSYCIVPAVRGAPRSRPLDTVLDEVRRRVALGQCEVVLTGVNIGLYRDAETRAGLDQVLAAVARTDGVTRVRVSSIESNHVNKRLLAVMAGHPEICPHLHVPLQSGDDAVLAEMGRHYDTRRYARAVDLARKMLPGLNLTTDVIVGYPTEDDASFARTLAFVEQMGFTKVHAFPFSQRPDTAAVAHADPVDRAVKAARGRRVRAVADRAALAHRQARVGTMDEVLVELPRSARTRGGSGALLTDEHEASLDARSAAPADAFRTGHTRDYSPVRFVSSPDCAVDAIPSGSVVVVSLDSVDAASGVLIARVTPSTPHGIG